MSERNRKKTRFIANFDGCFRLKGSYEWQDCYIYDISETGTLIRMRQSLLVDDEVEICLNINNLTDVIEGRVANTHGQVAGIEFITQNVGPIVDRAIDKAFSDKLNKKKPGQY